MTNNYIGLGEKSNFSTFHPIVNFTYFCAVILISMFSMNPVFLALTFIMGLIYSVILGGIKILKLHLAVAIPVFIIAMVVNPLTNHRGATVLFFLNDNAITLEAILYGLSSSVMLISVVMWFSCFNKIITSDKIIYLFGRAVPVIALLISMCFRFVPLLKSRFKEIREGQRYMGRVFGKWQLIKKGRLLAKEISILIAWSLEAAIETSDSMEARGYGLHGRTNFHIFKFSKRDRNALATIIVLSVFIIAGCILGVNNIYYYPNIYSPFSWKTILPFSVCYFILLLMPIIIDIKGEQRWHRLNSEM